MDFIKYFIFFGCTFAYVVSNEEIEERVRRQSGLDGAHRDAMRASSQGGFVNSHNPINFGGRVGAGYGTNVWSSGNRNLGVGSAFRSDVGITNNGRPFAHTPELGVGATYKQGANSFSLGAGKTFGSRPSNQVAFTFSRRFKRSLKDDVSDDLQPPHSEIEITPIIKNSDDQEKFKVYSAIQGRAVTSFA